MVLTRRQLAAGLNATDSQQTPVQNGNALPVVPVVPHTGDNGSGSSAARQTRSSGVNSVLASVSQPRKTKAAKSKVQTGTNSGGGAEASHNDTSLPVVAEDAEPAATTSEPPPKRRKTAGGAKKQTSKEAPTVERRITRSMRLNGFMNLPLDVILEVFCHMSPKDILTVSRTSKWLRGTVFARRNAAIWRESREQFEVPEPAEGFSEPRWASLLFDRQCQVCWNSRYSSKVQWNFLKRVGLCCYDVKVEPINGPHMRLLCSEAKDYVPWDHLEGGFYGKRFWTDEVVAIRKTWDELKRGAEDPAGREAFHRWKKESRDRMRGHFKASFVLPHNITTYKRWELTNDDNIKRDPKILRESLVEHDEEVQRMEDNKAKLLERGFSAVDIELSGLLIDNASCTAVITHQSPGAYYLGFNAAMPTIHKILDKTKNARLAFDKELLVWQRWDIFTQVYDEYISTLRPSEQQYCPPVTALRRLSDVDNLLEGAEFKPVAEDMQQYIDTAHSSMKQTLFRMCSRSDRKHTPEPWTLAKNVFQKRWNKSSGYTQGAVNSVRVGWDMIVTHRFRGLTNYELHDRPGVFVQCPRKFELNVQSSRNSERLIAMAGLSSMATVDEMDAADPRFACKNKGNGLTVYTWRSALLHIFKKSSHKMRLATEEEASAAKANDQLARAVAKAWSCNHCAQYLEPSQAATKQEICEHLSCKHSIMNPEMPTDYFINERCRYAYEVSYNRTPEDQLALKSTSASTCDMEPVILNGCNLSGWGSIGGRVGVLSCVMSRSLRRNYL